MLGHDELALARIALCYRQLRGQAAAIVIKFRYNWWPEAANSCCVSDYYRSERWDLFTEKLSPDRCPTGPKL
jgi:hypothetical protein